MLRLSRTSIVGLICLLVTGIVLTQEPELNVDFNPLFGTISMSEEAWLDQRNDDYFTVETRVSGNVSVDGLEAKEGDCEGYTTAAPAYRIDWVRDNIEEALPLRLFMIGLDGPTALIVREPDGEWLCAEDWRQTEHPLLDIERPRTGSYTVWVANAAAADTINGILYVTISDYVPSNPPRLQGQFAPLVLGSGDASSARIVYVESYERPEGLRVSMDVILMGERGDEFRALVYPYDAATDRPITDPSSPLANDSGVLVGMVDQLRLRSPIMQFDYGLRSPNPLEIELNDEAIPDDIEAYYPVFVIEMSQDSQGWQEAARLEAPRLTYHPQRGS